MQYPRFARDRPPRVHGVVLVSRSDRSIVKCRLQTRSPPDVGSATAPPAEHAQPADARAVDGAPAADGIVEAEAGGRQWPLGLRTTRARLVASYLVLLVVAGVVATFALRELLVIRLDDQINDDLRQEIAEITDLTHSGRDPD